MPAKKSVSARAKPKRTDDPAPCGTCKQAAPKTDMDGKPMSRDNRRLWMKKHEKEHAAGMDFSVVATFPDEENGVPDSPADAEPGEDDGMPVSPEQGSLFGDSAGVVPPEDRPDLVETGEEAEALGLGRSPTYQAMITLPKVAEKPDPVTFEIFTHKASKLSMKRRVPDSSKETPDPLTDSAHPLEERTWKVARRLGAAKNAKQANEAAEAILEALTEGEATKKVSVETEEKEYVLVSAALFSMRFPKEGLAEKLKDFKERLAFKGKKGEPEAEEMAKGIREEALGEIRVWLQNSMRKDRSSLVKGYDWDVAYAAFFKHFMRKLDPDHDNGPSFAAPAHAWLQTAYAEEQSPAPGASA